MMQLSWVKCVGNVWCALNNLDLGTVSGEGVYVIWVARHDGTSPVYVGQGSIRDRLEFHRTNREVQQFGVHGTLYVTWAAVSPLYQDGVEKHLADQLRPLVGERHPDVLPIAVNLPM